MRLLIDTWMNKDCTVGRLSYGTFQCLTLELPWLDNQRNVSCIPAGEYTGVKYNSPNHGDVILFKDVRGRDFIEIHAGNYTRQILGCILVGDSLKYLDSDSILDVTNSRATLGKLLKVLPESFKIVISRV